MPTSNNVEASSMRHVDCDVCEAKHIPLNDTIKIDGRVHCSDCFNAHYTSEEDLQGKEIEKDYDPTVCSFCLTDFDDVEVGVLSNRPICDSCEVAIRERTFPTWVKAFLAAIVVLVIGSVVWNMRYYQAYREVNESYSRIQMQDYSGAAGLMKSASLRLPEVEDLAILSAYSHGLELLSNDKCTEALAEFIMCQDKLPENFSIDALILQAKIGSTFENKDYDGFLDACLLNLELDPTSASSFASVSSAYACVYAAGGADTAKQNALLYLNKAKAIDNTSKEATDYYNMIEYRIESRRILRREEFVKQFPNGWTNN